MLIFYSILNFSHVFYFHSFITVLIFILNFNTHCELHIFLFNCFLLGIYFIQLKGCHFYFPDETTTECSVQSDVKKYKHTKIPDHVPERHPDGELFSAVYKRLVLNSAYTSVSF